MKKIIPCLDINKGRVVKGVNFVNLKDAGDPVQIIKAYCENGADEVVMLDISATVEHRDLMDQIIKKAAKEVTIPLTIGGGIKNIEDAQTVLSYGADKVGINSAIVKDITLVDRFIEKFGADKLVVAVDYSSAKEIPTVLIDGGMVDTGINLFDYVLKLKEHGAKELLLTSIDCDGKKTGYDIENLKKVKELTGLIVTASGGAGCIEDFYKAFAEANVDNALAASLFHFGEVEIKPLKKYLKDKGINVCL